MSDNVYNTLKWVAQIFLPALGTLIFAVGSIWGLSYAEQILGTVTAVDAFLGALLGVSSARYYARKSDAEISSFYGEDG